LHPAQHLPQLGFVWWSLTRQELESQWASMVQQLKAWGLPAPIELHQQDLLNAQHPSHYDYTSQYDLVIFRRLYLQQETVESTGLRRLETSAETAVQMHFNAQGNRTNDIMRTLTALTAIFLPLNLITGFFGMNFDFLPLIHEQRGLWVAVALMLMVGIGLGVVFWRKRYLSRTSR
jgi:hypothetical protein